MHKIPSFKKHSEYHTVAKEAIENFCKTITSRQRDVLYDWLDAELNITIERSVYDYEDKRSDPARFECTNDQEVEVVRKRIIRELEKAD